MAATAGVVLRYIDGILAVHGRDRLTDRELLTRFVERRDEAAFRALLERHGPMVLGVCERVLRRSTDVDDVFQATFLVLLKKAGAGRWGDSVAGWLHEVACRLARRANVEAAQRGKKESRRRIERSGDPFRDITLREAQAILHEELHRLAPDVQAPLVLCYLECATQDEAARRLGWSLRTLKRRLQRGRALLLRRLTRRGLTLSVVLATTLLTPNLTRAALVAATLRKAVDMATGNAGALSARVATFLDSVVASAFLAKAKAITAALVLVGALGALGAVVGGAGKPSPTERIEAKKAEPAKAVEKPGVEPRVDRGGDARPPGALNRLGTSRFRHGGAVFAMTYSPDGKTLVTGSGDRDCRLRIWDAATGRLSLCLEHADGQIYSVAVSPDGKTIAFGGDGSYVSVCDGATGKEIRRLTHVPEQPVYTIVFSPDGKTIASGGWDQLIHLWDVASGAERGQLRGHSGIVEGFTFSPDSRHLASAGDDKTIRLWDAATCKEIRRLPPFPKGARSVVFTKDGRRLATGCSDGAVALWDVASGKRVRDFEPVKIAPSPSVSANGPNRLAISPDGKALVSGSTGTIWDLETGKQTGRIEGQTRWVRALAVSPDGSKIVTEDHTCLRFHGIEGKAIPPDEGHQGWVSDVAFCPDGRTLGSAACDGTVRLWDRGGKLLRTLHGPPDSDSSICRLAISPDGKTVAARMGETLLLWDAATGRERHMIRRRGDWIRSLAFTPDGTALATGSGVDGTVVRLWDPGSGVELRSFGDQKGGMSHLAFSPDGKLLASSGGDAKGGMVCLWDMATGKKLLTLDVAGGDGFLPLHLASVAFAPQGNLVAAGGTDGLVRLWDARTGEERGRLKTGAGSIACVAFSPDGQMIGAVGDTGAVELWEVLTGRRRKTWVSHPGRCSALAFAPDGRSLATGGYDTTILLWNTMASPDAAARLSAKEADALWLALSDSDAAKAYAAMETLASAPRPGAGLLGERLLPRSEISNERIRALIADLASDQYLVRQSAQHDLRALGSRISVEAHRALAARPPLEMARRLESLLAQTQPLRTRRAIQVLEHIGSAEALETLQALARGWHAAPETRDAAAAVRRLTRTNR
ncbi:MAG: sigma-70 family RNA polymerase sigma factor [Gemmataceae bacterium]